MELNTLCSQKNKRKISKTCIDKFGFANPSLNLDVKNTCLKKFGVVNPFQSEVIKRVYPPKLQQVVASRNKSKI